MPEVGIAGGMQEVEEPDTLLFGGGGHGEATLDEALPGVALRAETSLAPKYRRPDSPLGLVVGRLHSFVGHEGPQRVPLALQFPRQGGRLGIAAFEGKAKQSPIARLEHRHALSERLPVDFPLPPLAVIPQKPLGFGHRPFAQRLGQFLFSFRDGRPVAQQMRMAQCPELVPFVRRPAITDDHPAIGGGDQLSERFLAPAWVQLKERSMLVRDRPQPVEASPVAKTGLVGMDHRGLQNHGPHFLSRDGQSFGGPFADGLDRTDRERCSEQLFGQDRRFPAAQAKTPRQPGHGSRKAWTELAQGNVRRQRGTVHLATARANRPMQPVLGDGHANGRQFRDLVRHGVAAGSGQYGGTARAGDGEVVDHLVGYGGGAESSRMTRLPAGFSSGRLLASQFGGTGRVGGGRDAGVAAVTAQFGFQLFNPGSQAHDGFLLIVDDRQSLGQRPFQTSNPAVPFGNHLFKFGNSLERVKRHADKETRLSQPVESAHQGLPQEIPRERLRYVGALFDLGRMPGSAASGVGRGTVTSSPGETAEKSLNLRDGRIPSPPALYRILWAEHC